jgi:two-component system, cell cycle response regulator CtrA
LHIFIHEPRPERMAGVVAEIRSEGCIPVCIDGTFFQNANQEIRLDSEWMHPVLVAGVPGSSELIRAFRRSGGKNPVLLYEDLRTADRIRLALEAGADQVVITPMRGKEIMARLHAVMRRIHGHAGGPARVGDLMIPFDGGVPEISNREIQTNRLETRILQRLALSPGQPVRRSEIYEALYGLAERKPFPRVIDRHIAHLRSKLAAAAPGGAGYVRTCPGHGYALLNPEDALLKNIRVMHSERSGETVFSS